MLAWALHVAGVDAIALTGVEMASLATVELDAMTSGFNILIVSASRNAIKAAWLQVLPLVKVLIEICAFKMAVARSVRRVGH